MTKTNVFRSVLLGTLALTAGCRTLHLDAAHGAATTAALAKQRQNRTAAAPAPETAADAARVLLLHQTVSKDMPGDGNSAGLASPGVQ